ncbi:MAG: nucleoside recognition protein [Desulforudis sp.]|nr:nucleoside recognition protein [Clostridia bacterium]MDQ7790508.1 nucleoside recognition domain-containing protein [Clostridia bacterium]RJX18734.1 MAG: nucleoside recognition protein [Desulforudis sp.]
MVTVATFKRGLGNGLHVTWELAKVTVPIYIAITILSHTPVLPWIADFCNPLMRLVGLPGEASLALIMGYTINLYGAIGVVLSLDLTHKQITIIASMLLLSHCLFLEAAVAKKTGVKVSGLVLTRLLLSVASGVLINWLY